MEDIIIIVILVILLSMGIRALIKHFKHESSCCGGGSQATKIPEKKLATVWWKSSNYPLLPNKIE